MKTLLIYPPFCTPASPPYSITNIHAFLKNNLPEEHTIEVLDLNIEFHKRMFPEQQKYYQKMLKNYDTKKYDNITNDYKKVSKQTYSRNNKNVVEGGRPELFDELLDTILAGKPDMVAFSIVYSSQCFFAYSLLKELSKRGIKTVIGGPAINDKLKTVATPLGNELELLSFIVGKPIEHNTLNFSTVLDYNIYNMDDYFTPEPVIPIRASNTCYYQKCAFCTHHTGSPYFEFSLKNIKESIVNSGQKNIFLVDDMIHRQRLLEIAEVFGPLGITWSCQLKPTIDLDEETLKTLHDSGLNVVTWGVESASDRVLKLMRKGTNIEDATKVIRASHKAGITNVTYIILGFPTETEEEAITTIDWLKGNEAHIDLVSTAIFGLQKGSPVYNNPEEFCITKITETKRTILDESIEYEVSEGMTKEDANDFRGRYKRTLENINKVSKNMNFFREHLLVLSKR
ncbi:B12-binding domain-containing radical SAM protein [Nanoarchaeota archaeon]